MSLHRTRQEIEDEQIRLAWIITAVTEATEDLASWILAEHFDLRHDECERLVNQMYDRLYRSLNTPQDMARAVLWLVSIRAKHRADEIAGEPELSAIGPAGPCAPIAPQAPAAASMQPPARPGLWRRLTGRA